MAFRVGGKRPQFRFELIVKIPGPNARQLGNLLILRPEPLIVQNSPIILEALTLIVADASKLGQ